MGRGIVRRTRSVSLGSWPIDGLPKVNPLWLLKYLPNMPNSHVAIYNDFRGPNNPLTVREAILSVAVAEAADIIQRGWADVMVVGATGTRIHPLRTIHSVLVDKLAQHQSDPTTMSRPFDSTSDGMVLGEGAGAWCLSRPLMRQRGERRFGVVCFRPAVRWLARWVSETFCRWLCHRLWGWHWTELARQCGELACARAWFIRSGWRCIGSQGHQRAASSRRVRARRWQREELLWELGGWQRGGGNCLEFAGVRAWKAVSDPQFKAVASGSSVAAGRGWYIGRRCFCAYLLHCAGPGSLFGYREIGKRLVCLMDSAALSSGFCAERILKSVCL